MLLVLGENTDKGVSLMNRRLLKLIAWSLSAVMVISSISYTGSGVIFNNASDVYAADIPVMENLETTASSGKIIIGVEGINCTSDMATLLKRINEVRKEACYAGNILDPRDRSRKRYLQPSDYKEMKIGVNCSKAASLRAAEASILMNHARTNGTDVFTILQSLQGSGAYGENLAWNAKLSSDIEGWIAEKDDWIKYKGDASQANVGHYGALVNPDYVYTGMSTFNPNNDSAPYNWSCTAGQYSSNDTELKTLPGAQNTTYIQKMEISVGNVVSSDISGEAMLNIGDTSQYELLVAASFNGVRQNTVTDCPVYSGVTWSSSTPSVVSIDASGNVTAKAEGTAKITASFGGKSVSREVLVVTKGTTISSVKNPAMVTTESNKVPVLAKTVEATLSNGSKVNIDAKWGTYDTAKLLTHFKSEEFDVAGTAGGFPVTQRIHVNAAKIQKVYPSKDSVTTNCGSLPEQVDAKINLSNGYTWTYPSSWNSSYFTVWDKASLEQCNTAAGGDFTITGYVKINTDNGEEHYPISVKVHVNSGTPTEGLVDNTPVSGNGNGTDVGNGGVGNASGNTSGTGTAGGGSGSAGNASSTGNSGNAAIPTPTVEQTNPTASPYRSEWINGIWYDENGNNTYSGTLGWKSNGSGWWIEDSAGWYPVSTWQKIDGNWYYFNAAGYMASNEYVDGYWLNGDGTCSNDYYLTWKCNLSGWWVEDVSGWWPSNKWLKVDNCWYYFDSSGYMVTNQYIDGYWIGSDGVCQ